MSVWAELWGVTPTNFLFHSAHMLKSISRLSRFPVLLIWAIVQRCACGSHAYFLIVIIVLVRSLPLFATIYWSYNKYAQQCAAFVLHLSIIKVLLYSLRPYTLQHIYSLEGDESSAVSHGYAEDGLLVSLSSKSYHRHPLRQIRWIHDSYQGTRQA
jgi:hypothetical protein